MSNRALPVLLVLLLLVAAGAIWLVLGDSGGESTARADGAQPVASPVAKPGAKPDAPDRAPAKLASAPAAPEEEASEPVATVGERREATGAYEAELAAGHWVEGRVVFPEGTPLAERVFVVAKGKDFEHGDDHKVEVAPDGAFRVAFSERTKTGRLDIDASYLHLEKPLKLKTKSIGSEAIVLEPLLGGRIVGTVTPPEGSNGGEIVGADVAGYGVDKTANTWRRLVSKKVQVADDLTYEINGLPAHLTYEVQIDLAPFEAEEVDELSIEAGEDRVIDLVLEHGVTLAGRVVDPQGEPVAGVEVQASVKNRGRSWGPSHRRSRMTKADGTFRLEGIAPGNMTLSADAKGYEKHETNLENLERGHVDESFVLVLERGNAIAGTVLWPDGTPAAGAFVDAEAEESDRGWRDPRKSTFKTDSDGRFEITGLDEGSYRLDARGTRKEKVTVISKITGKEKEKTKRTTWRAAESRVESGTSGLVLTLGPGLDVPGRVVDDVGAPVKEFKLTAQRVVENYSWNPKNRRQKRFEAADGTFELALEEGRWTIVAEAEGHSLSEEHQVQLPGPKDPLVITLPRAARLSGFVRAPNGAPVANAKVEVEAERRFRNYWGWRPDTDRDVQTDENGYFLVEEAPTGPVEIVATANGYAASEELSLELAPGSVADRVELALRVGGRITGELLATDGKPAARRTVQVWGRGIGRRTSTQTDAEGTFFFEHLPPGEYTVSAPGSDEEAKALGQAGEDLDILERRAEVEVADGRTAHVVLAPPQLNPVRIHGTVLAGDEPMAGVHIWLRLQDEGSQSSVDAETDSDGNYSAIVSQPGTYSIQLWQPRGGTNFSLEEVIPETDEYRVDIAYPVGRISGRVFGPDGPVAAIQVSASRRSEEGEHGWGHSSDVTDDDGYYELRSIPAGTWTVEAGGPHGRWVNTAEGFARNSVENVVVAANAHVTGVDLHLEAAGSIGGRVFHADGSAASEARVYVRDPQGQSVSRGWVRTDAGGRYEVQGLPPGDYTVGAFKDGLATAKLERVQVRVQEETRVDLELGPATLLRVVVQNEAGEQVSAGVQVVDETGRDYSTHFKWTGKDDPTRHFNALPPGNYTVTATDGGKSAKGTVQLNGEEVRDLNLTLL